MLTHMTNDEHQDFLMEKITDLRDRASHIKHVIAGELKAAADCERAANELENELYALTAPSRTRHSEAVTEVVVTKPLAVPVPVVKREIAPEQIQKAAQTGLGLRLALALKQGG
jgi:hypothetical protein